MLLCVYLKMGHFSPARITTGISAGRRAAAEAHGEGRMLPAALLRLNYCCSWNKPTQMQAPGSPGGNCSRE